MKISLNLKYRPTNFDDLHGQDIIKKTLKNASKENRFSHAYLFTGPRGTGKTSTARIVAKALNCLNIKEDGNPCDKCEICMSFNLGKLIDVIEIDAASNRGIDEIRDLKEKIKFSPNQGKFKIYIIDEVHMLTKEAFNALLKTLEEPPNHTYFILATTEFHKVPETIVSRCQKFSFERISNPQIIERLQLILENEKIKYNPKALDVIARASDGGMRDAISLMEKIISNNTLEYDTAIESLDIVGEMLIKNFVDSLFNSDFKNSTKIIDNLYEKGVNMSLFMRDTIVYLKDLLLNYSEKSDISNFQKTSFMINTFLNLFEDLKYFPDIIILIYLAISKIYLNQKDNVKSDNKYNFIKLENENIKNIEEIKDDKKEVNVDSLNNQEVLEFGLEKIKLEWKKFIEIINNPNLKPPLRLAIPKNLENNKLYIEVNSKYYLEKLNDIKNKDMIFKKFNEYFDTKNNIDIVFELAKVNLNLQEEPKSNNNTEDALNDVFDNRLI